MAVSSETARSTEALNFLTHPQCSESQKQLGIKVRFNEYDRQIAQYRARLKTFYDVYSRRNDYSKTREFYLQNASVLVPEHDYEIEKERAKEQKIESPDKPDFFHERALQIFEMDLNVARRFAKGIEVKGENVGLFDLIVEEQGKLLEAQAKQLMLEHYNSGR